MKYSRFRFGLSLALCVSAMTSVAHAQDGDGDGVRDARDICPGTPAGLTVDGAGCDAYCEVEDVGTDVFIRSRLLEVGTHDAGSFGSTASAPAGWHPRPEFGETSGNLGFVANPQANDWTRFNGDFFVPGTPEEAWGLAIDTTARVNAGLMGLEEIPGTFTGTRAECLPDVCGLRGGAAAFWAGTATGVPATERVRVEKTYTVLNQGLFILVEVTLTNEGLLPHQVTYFRNVDPDNQQPLTGSYETRNTIVSQGGPGGTALVSATTAATAAADASYIALVSSDPDARVTYGGFSNRSPNAVWSCTGLTCTVGSASTDDVAISLAIRKTVPAGESVTFSYAYTLDPVEILTATECTIPSLCGDGFVEGTESCDDGNTTDGDGCDSTCRDEAGYECNGEPSVCSPICGDGTVVGSETCDDGATTAGDGCSATCRIETGWTCMGAPSSCAEICGDTLVVGTETCDDGGTMAGDGCSMRCHREIAITSPADGTLTNDPTPTISGTSDPGATVMVSLGGVMGTAVANGAGVWTFTPTTPVPDGTQTVSAVALDRIGETSTDSITIEIDTSVSVAITEPVDGSTTTDTTPTISGTGEVGAMVAVTVDGMMLGIATVAADGTWSLAVDAPLAEGTHVVVAVATDAAGNTAMAGVTFTIDLSSEVAIVTPADGARVMSTTPTITGTAEPGASVEVTVDGTVVGTVVAAGDGTWSIAVTEPLADGEHDVVATATDVLGNVGSAMSDFTVDTGTTVTWEQPSVTGDATPELSGTGEPGASVEVSIDGSVVGTAIVDAEGNWTLGVGPLTDGMHDVSVIATDDAGNTATDDGSFVVDLDGPSVEIRSPAQGSTTSDTTPTISGNATPGASVLVLVDGVIVGIASADATGAWSIEESAALANGEHEVVASVTDADGNTVEDAHDFTVDTDAPSVSITSPTDGVVTNDATPTISGSAEPNAEVQVFVDGVLVGTVTADAEGDWSLDTTTELADGAHSVRAVARDADGNTATDGGTFTVDTETTVTIVAPADGATVPGPRPTISGTAEAGATVVVSIDGAEVGTVVADAAGRWSLRAPDPLSAAEHTASVVATDAVGNTASDASTFTIDTVLDTDGDGFPDTEECPSEPCRDSDEDGNPDFDDPDDDGDGIPTAIECPGATACVDTDEDETPNYLDPDDDDDGIPTLDEGSGATDTDADGVPDHLDVDDDGDGLPTTEECSATPCRDTDDDGRPDYLDPDDDGDAIPTTRERADGSMHGNDVDDDGDPNWLDTNADGDSRGDTEEGVGDTDGDGIPDYLDPEEVAMPDGGMPDGGVDGGVPDGGAGDAGVDTDSGADVDAGTEPTAGGYSGGALCAANGGSDTNAGLALALVGLALVWRRRRR